MKQFDRVEIEWVDSSHSALKWCFLDEINFEYADQSLVHVSIGYFIKRTKAATYISMSKRKIGFFGGEEVDGPYAIPNCAIKSIRVLKD